MDRALASIKQIKQLRPFYSDFENKVEAESVCEALIEGWSVMVKRGEFNEGDLCVFFEIDSILPECEWSEFMRSRKFRVQTMKSNRLRNVDGNVVISQGLALPYNQIFGYSFEGKFPPFETDVTEILGVRKYEVPEKFVAGNPAGRFPSFIPKTDEHRIQSHPKVLDELRGHPYYITEKLDGTSATYWYDDANELHAASRNFEIKRHDDSRSVYWKIGEQLPSFPQGYAVQGEIVGPNIQRNLLELRELKFFCFNVYNIEEKRYLNFNEWIEFCVSRKINTVPIMHESDGSYTLDSQEQLERLYVHGCYYNTNNPREGIVVRPMTEMYSPSLQGRLSFKFINPDYLLKVKE